jgi:hypothetical protein
MALIQAEYKRAWQNFIIDSMRPTRPDDRRPENNEEPPEIRGLTKKKLYEVVSQRFHVPGCDSRGVTRDWLSGVYRGIHYRVPLLEHKHFYADLAPAHLKKAPVLYCGPLLAKLNSLLNETGNPDLGFPQGVIPEEDWLVSIIRFVDRANVLGAFFSPVPGAHPPQCETQRMTVAKQNAERFLFLDGNGNNLLHDKKLFKEIEGIHDQSKRIMGHRQELHSLVDQGRALERKVQVEEAELSKLLYNVAVSVYTRGQRMEDPGPIFIEGDDAGAQHRERVQEILRLLRFIYISDAATDRSEATRRLCDRFAEYEFQPPRRDHN